MKTVLLILTLMMLSAPAIAMENIEAPKNCQMCRMDRTMFAQSRMVVVYADGSSVGVCSIHCAVEEMMANREKQVKTLLIADFRTKKLADAREATWIVGGKKKGVMTALPKWAFVREEDAAEFLKENGGTVMALGQVINTAGEEVMEMADMRVELID